MIRALAFLTLALAQPAGAFELAWPADCALGTTCHIQQYVDHDPGPAATDFTCGPLSYDGHDGTDIALNSRAEMAQGVAVLAAARGVVKAVRDGVEDFQPRILGKECGNGVIITHEGGWETQYCHMEKGSLLVKPGEPVETGAKLGLIGQSGWADFPHVHLTVRHDGQTVDPFEPDPTAACNATPGPGLWNRPVPYEPGGFFAAGFAAVPPTYEAVRAGIDTPSLATNAPGIVLWAFAFGTRKDDVMTFQITGPGGAFFSHGTVLEKPQAQMFRAEGRKLTLPEWPVGAYHGVVSLFRSGTKVDQVTADVQVLPHT